MIEEIIEREWEFFDKVQHIDGRASCQDDYETFFLQRTAQFRVFDHDILASYIQDLRYYKKIDYNPLMLKYARMMSSSDPRYYETIKNQLPQINEESEQLIEAIVQIELSMREEFNELYPYLSARARITHTSEDQKDDVSFETYLRAELSTYSSQTLYLYGQNLIKMVNENENMIMKIQAETVKAYGYKSLEQANQSIKDSIK